MTITSQHPNLDGIINSYQYEKIVIHNIFLPSFIIIWLEIGESGGEPFCPLPVQVRKSPVQTELSCQTEKWKELQQQNVYQTFWFMGVFELWQNFVPQANQHSPDLAGLFRNSIDLLGAVLCSTCLNMPTSSPIIKDDLYICLEGHKICWIQLNLFCDILKCHWGIPPNHSK